MQFARVVAVMLIALFSCGCTVALYAPWHRPPTVSQAPQDAMPGQQGIDIAGLSLLARVMIDHGEPVDKILATLRAEGLSESAATKVLYAALAPSQAQRER